MLQSVVREDDIRACGTSALCAGEEIVRDDCRAGGVAAMISGSRRPAASRKSSARLRGGGAAAAVTREDDATLSPWAIPAGAPARW